MHEGRIVDEVSGGKVVAAVDDHVPLVRQDALDVFTRQALLVFYDLHVWIEIPKSNLGAVHLWDANARGRVKDLPLEVRRIHYVGIDQAQCADTSRRQIEG